MRLSIFTVPVALVLTALALSSCARRGELPTTASATLSEDDDVFCRKGGQVATGSPEYVNCRKDRDALRGGTIDRADKKQRDLGEYMMNNPVRP